MPINVNGKLRIKGLTTGGNGGGGGTDFISVWDTTLGKEPSIELPLVASGNYNFSVNWGDGNTDTITAWDQSERTHAYATGGVYTVTITGTIEGWSFSTSNTSAQQLTSITNIGQLKLGNEGGYFAYCSNLTTIGGTFDLTGTTNFSSMFDGCSSLTSVNGIGSWDTSAVTNMDNMFYYATAFNQDISGWNVSSVTNMGYMFGYTEAFNQDISGWNTSAVTNMSGMFEGTTAFNQDISGWDVSSVNDMSYMFGDTTAFNQPLNSWDVSAVTNMQTMFNGATSFNQPLNSWNVSAVTDMNSMFAYATAFNGDISGWDVSAVTNMASMFEGTIAFNQDISGWDVSSVTDMNYMFGDTTSFNQPLNLWNTAAVTDMSNMFVNATAFNQDISSWNVSSITTMSGMFTNATSFNQDISSWDISNVIDMDDFMYGKSTANYSYYDNLLNAWSLLTLQPNVFFGMGSIEYTSAGATARQDIIDNYSWTITDGGELVSEFISVWDTTLGDGNPSIALPLAASGNYNFIVNWGDGNTDTITAWDQAEVTHTYATGGVKTITITGTIEGWLFNGVGDCAKLTSITDIGPLKIINASSFKGCSNLTTIGGTFDLTGTTDFNYMFADCTSLTSVNGIGSWNTSAVTNMGGMFYGATAFNQPLNLWDVSSVTNMGAMFTNAATFNQPLNSWDVSSVTDMAGMFYNATAFNQDISSWDVSGIIGSPTKPEGMGDFMGTDGDPLSFSYYDNLLNAWSALTLQNDVTWGMGPIEYTSAGAAARASIISNYSWNITDGGLYTIPFVSVWDTTLGDGNPTITLPLIDPNMGGNYNFTVNWGDGNTDTITAYDQAEVTHTYATGGTYTVTITGTIEGWTFQGVGDCQKLTSITDIGYLKLGNTGGYFNGCSNLTTIGGTFDLTGTTDFSSMFAGCSLLTSVNGISSWNTSAVTNMGGMFDMAELFNQNISSWDTSAVTSMRGMFGGAVSFNQPLNSWDVSAVTTMEGMFAGASLFNQPLNSWDVSAVTTMSGMFDSATAFNQDISSWDISNVIDMDKFMTGKSTANYSYYDNLLNAWSLLTLQNGVTWDMGTIQYTSTGATARAFISDKDGFGWTITDGGLAA